MTSSVAGSGDGPPPQREFIDLNEFKTKVRVIMIVYSMIHTVIIERAVWAPSVAARCGRPAWPRGVGA